MARVMDHVQDVNGEELFHLSTLYPLPDFVKKADFDVTLRPKATLAITNYGDPRSKLYPCHNAASTFLSVLYFQEKRAEFNVKDQRQIESRLDGYVNYFGIRREVEAFREKWAAAHRTVDSQRPDSDYAYVWVNQENGQKERRFPLTTNMEVKAAAEYALQHRDMIPFQARHMIAKRVMEKAAMYGVALGDELREFIQKQAGHGVCDVAEVGQMIRNRAHLVRNVQVKEAFDALATTVLDANKFAFTPDNMVKLAETIDQLDRTNNFVGKYCATLPRPEDVIFKITYEKAASDLSQVVATTDGKIYEKEAFSRLSMKDVTDLFGTEFASRVRTPLGEIDVEKFAEEAATLPRGEAAALGRLLSDVGVGPALTKAASAGQGFSADQWAKLAEAYRPPVS